MEFFSEIPVYSIMGEGVVIRAQIGYDYEIPEGEVSVKETVAGAKNAAAEPAEPETVSEVATDGAKNATPETTAQATESAPSAAQASAAQASAAQASAAQASAAQASAANQGDNQYATKILENIEPEYKGGFAEDFKWSFILANTQFRGAKHIFKKLKTLWYDDKLFATVRNLERFFVTFIVFLIGMLAILFSVVNTGAGDKEVFLMILAWIVIDCVIVSPLIYYIALPKPIKSHIRDISKLTDEEKELLKRATFADERLEKIMKKYKNSEMPNRLDRE